MRGVYSWFPANDAIKIQTISQALRSKHEALCHELPSEDPYETQVPQRHPTYTIMDTYVYHPGSATASLLVDFKGATH